MIYPSDADGVGVWTRARKGRARDRPSAPGWRRPWHVGAVRPHPAPSKQVGALLGKDYYACMLQASADGGMRERSAMENTLGMLVVSASVGKGDSRARTHEAGGWAGVALPPGSGYVLGPSVLGMHGSKGALSHRTRAQWRSALVEPAAEPSKPSHRVAALAWRITQPGARLDHAAPRMQAGQRPASMHAASTRA